MSETRRILLLDDDEDLLELYRDMLAQLPSLPEVQTVTSGDAAFAMLESQPFHVLISDLRMPRMDGLQVITIVRKRFPDLKTVVMSGVGDEESKTRAFGLGVDLYLEKPRTAKEITRFNECVENLLTQKPIGQEGGKTQTFIQKNISDAVQLECLAMGSCVVKISKKGSIGHIYIERGVVVDAESGMLAGEEAFNQLIALGTAGVEVLPPEPGRHRTIVKSLAVLLGLETEEAHEAASSRSNFTAPPPPPPVPAPVIPGRFQAKPGFPRQPVVTAPPEHATTQLAELARTPELDSLMILEADGTVDVLGIESKEIAASVVMPTVASLRDLAAHFDWGAFQGFSATGPKLHWELRVTPERTLSACFRRALSRDQARESMKQILQKWDS